MSSFLTQYILQVAVNYSYLTVRKQRVVLDGVCSDWLPIASGVPQGSILGPLLFLVYANDAPNYIQSQSTIALFADDSKLYKSIDGPDSSNHLQHDLDNLNKWSLDWAMDFNKSKCQTLRISRKKTRRNVCYKLDGQQIKSVECVTDLGITISNDLSW